MILFILTNEQRGYLGLELIEEHWKCVNLWDEKFYILMVISYASVLLFVKTFTEKSRCMR